MAPKKRVVTFDGFFEVSFQALQFAGWRLKQETAPKWHKFYCWAAFGNFVASVLNGALYLVMNLGREGRFLEITDSAGATAIGSLTILKAFMIIFTNRDETASILDILKEYLRDSETKVSKDEVYQTMRKLKKFLRVFFVLNIALILVFSVNAIIGILYGLFTPAEYQTPFPAWYPFEDSCGFAFIVVFLLQTWTVLTSALFGVGSDSMFCAMTAIMCLKFEELKYEICMAKTAQELKHCIAAHVDLIEMCEKLSKIYEPVIFYNFFIASVVICMAGFQTTAAGNADMARFLNLCMVTLLQCFMICYFADRLRESSGSIAGGAFESIWRNKDREMTQQIVMIILRAQRPQHFKGFLFGRVTMMVFTVVVNASYSYYGFLRLKYAGP